MFDLSSFYRRHLVPGLDPDGDLVIRRGTCAEVEKIKNTAHLRDVPDGAESTTVIFTCAQAEDETRELRARVASLLEYGRQQADTADRRERELIDGHERRERELIDRLTASDARAARAESLMGGSLKIIFHMRSSLDRLSKDNLGEPGLTDDKTMVALTCPLYSVLIDPFHPRGARITLVPATDAVPERSFTLVGGKLSDDQQTLFLGHIARIRAANENGKDLVTGELDLVGTGSSS